MEGVEVFHGVTEVANGKPEAFFGSISNPVDKIYHPTTARFRMDDSSNFPFLVIVNDNGRWRRSNCAKGGGRLWREKRIMKNIMNLHGSGKFEAKRNGIDDRRDLEWSKFLCFQFSTRAVSLDMTTIKEDKVTNTKRRGW
jgi:hypothetical protein